MTVCTTPRLLMRRMLESDAPYILELLNDPAFKRNIGDREVRTLDDARRYIQSSVMASYNRHGFGLYIAELREDGSPVGICGLLKRDYLEDVDVGFALSERFRGQGLAGEAAKGVMDYARRELGLKRIAAITAPHNQDSIRLLLRLGMSFQGQVTPPPDSGTKLALNLYTSEPEESSV